MDPPPVAATPPDSPTIGAPGELQPARPKQATLSQREGSAVKIQRMIRGMQARERIRVQTLSDGVVHTRIRGDADLLQRIDVKNVTTAGPASIDIVSIDPVKFESQLVGGKQIYSLQKMSGAVSVRTLLGDTPQATSRTHIFVNGGFFNLRRKASNRHPDYSSIGESVVNGAVLPECLPIPSGYEADFVKISFDDGSSLTAGPELVKGKQIIFNKDKLQDARYQWRDGKGFKPGMPRHAEHPNTRSAIVFPGPADAVDAGPNSSTSEAALNAARMDRIRILLATSTNGGKGAYQNGLNLADTATLAQRLGRMNATQGGHAINLDGGKSSQLSVVEKSGTVFRQLKLSVPPPIFIKPVAANFIAFSRKTDTPDD